MRTIGFKRDLNFVGHNKLWGIISITAVVLSLVVIFTKGLKYGIDFAGGTEIQVRFFKTVSIEDIRKAVSKAGFKNSNVQRFGEPSGNEFLVRVQMESLNLARHEEDIRRALKKAFPNVKIMKLRFAGDNAYVAFEKSVPEADIKKALDKMGVPEAKLDEVKRFGKEENNEYLLKFKGATARIERALEKAFGKDSFEIRRVESVGAKVGAELRNSGILAILVSLFFILVYIGFRFDFTYAPGAVICLFHDVIIIVGVFALTGKEFSLTIIAALLTLVGYSLNDTIVVFDRIRENVQKMSGRSIREIVNISINQTLSRTLLTSITTLLVTIPLLILGGRILHDFAFALTLGVIVGTYSSIFVAASIFILIENRQRRKRKGI